MMKLSVIIPVYNAEAYLEKCVESVIAFPMEKEVILVDDGSSDRSGEIIDRLAGEEECVKCIHQVNKGVSAARNVALEMASGDYVWFVDADDSVLDQNLKPQGVALGYGATSLSGCCLTVLGFVWEENGQAKSFGASKDEVPYNLWRCWFDRKVIEDNHLWFTEGRKYAEDQEFILQFLLASNAKKKGLVEAIDAPLYYYTLRPGSAMTRKGVKWKMVKDVACVLCGFAWNALSKNAIMEKWVWKEMKRLAKTLYVTIKR